MSVTKSKENVQCLDEPTDTASKDAIQVFKKILDRISKEMN